MSRTVLSLLCTFIFLVTFTFTEARIPKKLPSAVVVGTVYCDTCFYQDLSKFTHFIAGASVAVECGGKYARPNFREVAKTNEHGEFKVQLPFSVSKHVKKIKGCCVKLINSSEPHCAVASMATSSSIRLKPRKHGTHIFSAGVFTFKPLKQPELCDEKPTIQKPEAPRDTLEKTLSVSHPNDPKFLPPIQDLPTSYLPPVDQNYLPPLPELPHLQPLPRLPPLPTLPELPLNPPGPGDEKAAEPDFFNPIPLPPNPLLPPPTLLPPITNPFQPPPSIIPPVFPSPPPSIFPPIFPSPPPSVFPPIFPPPSANPPSFQLPPLIPGLTPSPPPPPPPFLPIPFPPFPFQPTPGFPGVPPATPSSP